MRFHDFYDYVHVDEKWFYLCDAYREMLLEKVIPAIKEKWPGTYP